MNSSTPIARATSLSSATPTGGAESPDQAAVAAQSATSSVVWRIALPLAFSVMEAPPIAMLALFILLSSHYQVEYAPLSLLALVAFTAPCVWLAMLFELARAWMRPRGLDGFVVTGYVLLWVAGFVIMVWLQLSIFFQAPDVSSNGLISSQAFIAGVVVSALCFTWLYIRAISFAGASMRRNEQAHRWLLTSFKWELVVFAALLVLGAGVADRATYYTTSLIALPLFVVGGLVAVALARQVALVWSRSYVAATAAPQAWYRWLGVFAAAAIVALVIFEALFLSGVLTALLSAVTPLVNAVSSGLGHLFGGLKPHQSPVAPHTTPNQGGTTTQPQTTPSSQPSTQTTTISGWLGIVILIALEVALLVGALLLSLWRRRLAGNPAAAPLRRVLGVGMWVLLALAILLGLLLALSLIASLFLPPGSVTHTLVIPLPGGGGISIQLPFSFPSFGVFGNGGSPTPGTSGTSTGRPQSTPSSSKHPTSSPLGALLLILEIIVALGVLAAVIVLIVLVVIGVRLFLRWRRARRAATNAPEPTATTAQAAPDPTLRGDAARVYYRRLLQAAAAVGGEYARQPAETPREYAVRLRSLLTRADAPAQLRQAAAPVGLATPVAVGASAAQPDGVTADETSIALDELTSAYRVARYRGDHTDNDRAARLRPWLARLLTALRA